MIQVNNLYKSYKKSKAQVLEDISLQIADGEVVALLGHNGCGKSTLLKCLVGVLKPTSGAITIDGVDTFRQQKKIRDKIGVVFNQKPSFIVDLEVMDNLLYFKAIYNIPKQQFEEMLNLVDQYLNIKSLYHKPYRKLSFGERVKCEIASVLLHIPKYIFLDEPTIGLDYNAKAGLYQLMKYFNETYHSTVIVITHEVDYIQDICTHAVIISEGRVRYDGSIDEITKRIKQKYSLSVTYDGCTNPDMMEGLKQRAESIDTKKQVMTFVCDSEEDKKQILEKAVQCLNIHEVKSEISSLKEVFTDVLQEINQHR